MKKPDPAFTTKRRLFQAARCSCQVCRPTDFFFPARVVSDEPLSGQSIVQITDVRNHLVYGARSIELFQSGKISSKGMYTSEATVFSDRNWSQLTMSCNLTAGSAITKAMVAGHLGKIQHHFRTNSQLASSDTGQTRQQIRAGLSAF